MRCKVCGDGLITIRYWPEGMICHYTCDYCQCNYSDLRLSKINRVLHKIYKKRMSNK